MFSRYYLTFINGIYLENQMKQITYQHSLSFVLCQLDTGISDSKSEARKIQKRGEESGT